MSPPGPSLGSLPAMGLLLALASLVCEAGASIRPEAPSADWILQRIQQINARELDTRRHKLEQLRGREREREEVANNIESAVSSVSGSSEYRHLSAGDIQEARALLLQLEDILVMDEAGQLSLSTGARSGRGLLDLFTGLADLRHDSTLIRGGNSTGPERGILEFVADVAGNILGGVSNKNDGPVLIPNHCW